MNDWAERELEREQREKEATQYHTEKSVREARIKDELGPGHFKQLRDYITGQVAKYNKGKGTQVLIVPPEPSDTPDSRGDLMVRRKDGLGHTLTVVYRHSNHTVEWKCGPDRGHFNLRVRDDGSVYLETPTHSYASIEEIGNDLLTKLQESAR